MTILASLCFLVGAVLGLRFKVLILVPVTGLSWVLVIANGIVNGESLWRLALALVVVATAIQLGYVGGMVAQLVFGSTDSARSTEAREHRPAPDAARRIA